MELYTDIAVIGSGPSGIAAALKARHFGARVLLVEKDGFLGGMSTGGLLNVWCGSADSGIFREICKTQVHQFSSFHSAVYNPEDLKAYYIDKLEGAGVDILLHAYLTGTSTSDGHIDSANLTLATGNATLHAKIYIDSTGNGDLAYLCGVPFRKGRPSDNLMQPLSLIFTLGGIDENRAVFPTFSTHPEYEDQMRRYVEEGRISQPAGHVITVPGYIPGTASVNMTNVIRCDGTDSFDLTRAELHTRKQIPQIVAFLRECIPGYEDCYVLSTGTYVGVRETRHFDGDYLFTEEDILAQRVFEDHIVRNAAYTFGNHNLTGSGSDARNLEYHGERYTIPYRSFLPLGVDNLLLNGRNISGTHMAHSSYRVMPICFAMGEGIGLAAADCVRRGCCTRGADIGAVQSILFAY